MSAPETARLTALRRYAILDTPAEGAFDRLTALAADLFDAPIALVSLVDADRQWFKARTGLDARETDRDSSFCAHAIKGKAGSVMVVENAAEDPRFRDNPLVTGYPSIRFYAGAVLTSLDGFNLGALCVIDDKPRPRPSDANLRSLQNLAGIVMEEMELRLARQEAEGRQRHLEQAERLAGLGRWTLDLASGRSEWSDAMFDLYGVDRAAFQPGFKSILNLCRPEEQARIAAAVQGAIAAKSGFDLEFRFRRPDGEERHVRSRAVCQLSDHGAPVALFGVLQDVTEQRRAQLALARSEASYRLLAENTSDMLLRCDDAGHITYISPSCRQITGYEPDAIVGRSWLEFVRPEDRERLYDAIMAQVSEGAAHAAEPTRYALIRADGRQIELEGRPTLIFDPRTGQPTGLNSVVRDVTARRLAEQALERARAEAEAATTAKAEFLANMSHELRTPLTAVLGFSRLIGDQPELSDATRGYLERVASGGEALLTTVNDILDFSKLEAGQVKIRPRACEAASLARAVVDLFSLQAAQKSLALDIAGAERLPSWLMIDPDRIRQVLLNLLGNAVKFTEAGAVRLELAYDVEGERLDVSVTDSGPGIEQASAARLFNRFAQAEHSEGRGGSSGLGLAICKGLVEAMGGAIGLDSRPGEGSRFWFSIPAQACEAPETAPQAAAAPAPRGRRVLVTDDNPANRALVGAILGAYDLQVAEARDGAEAVRAAQDSAFDLILMDLKMPGEGGVATAQRLRATPGPNQSTPILAFSADVVTTLPDGLFNGALAKPIHAQALLAAVFEALASDNRAARDSAAVA